jgi:hypothetical protein
MAVGPITVITDVSLLRLEVGCSQVPRHVGKPTHYNTATLFKTRKKIVNISRIQVGEAEGNVWTSQK